MDALGVIEDVGNGRHGLRAPDGGRLGDAEPDEKGRPRVTDSSGRYALDDIGMPDEPGGAPKRIWMGGMAAGSIRRCRGSKPLRSRRGESLDFSVACAPSAGAPRHIPHTVIVRSPMRSIRRKILSSHRLPSLRSKTTRWPASLPQRSMYSSVCRSPSRTVRSRLLCNTLHSITNRSAAASRATPSPRGQMTSRSVRPRPRPYSRSMRPPLFTTRCRNACNRSCGPASA